MDLFEKFKETELPAIDKFYSRLTDQTLSFKDYEHAMDIWYQFDIKNLGENHDLYLNTNVLLLSDVFENFRKACLEYYKLLNL